MIDICTVVFEDELPILRLQATSVAQYCTQLGIRNIYVVLNDAESLVEKIDPNWWGPLAGQVLVVPRTAFSAPWANNGWLSQQLFKMLAASMSYNTWTMVLDAKTIFVRELTLDQLLTDKGQVTTGQMPVYDVFRPAKEICDQLFSQDTNLQVGPGGVPFFFHNNTVRAMISDCSDRTNESFPLWFQKQGMLTEFMLYSAYAQYRYGNLDALYTPTNTLGEVVNVCHNEVALYDQKLVAMKNPNTLTVSIHRNAWKELTEEQKNAYRLFLIDRGNLLAFSLA